MEKTAERQGSTDFRTCPYRLRQAWQVGLAVFLAGCCLAGAELIDGVTFATSPGKLYVPLDEVGRALHWQLKVEEAGFQLNSRPLDTQVLRQLVDGTVLVPLAELERIGALTAAGAAGQVAVIGGRRHFTTTAGPKRAEVSLARQQLRAWQGERLVLQTHISSGRGGSTPAGDFTAGPYKARMHYSKRYHNAPMPWSVQIHGHVFIHGFSSVPDYPASHGCIRVPLTGGNPARFFYEWIDPGTPVKVTRS
jgi:L,D-transpeptidase catalytic domain